MPSARSCRAFAPAASVADGCTELASREIGIIKWRPQWYDMAPGQCARRPIRQVLYAFAPPGGRKNTSGRNRMRVAHFVHRYPPALGGSEAYFARLSKYLTSAGAQVTVFTTTAIDLQAFWSRRGRCLPAGLTYEDGIEVRRYQPRWRFRGRRYILKPLSLLPVRSWQRLTLPCNPMAWGMLADAGQADQPFDLVHATAFPYAWPIACGLRLARRLHLPFLLTPFLHLGDPDDPKDRTRRAYTTPALLSLIRAADGVFVQTPSEHEALRRYGIPAERLILLGMGVAEEECTGGDQI